MTKEQINRLAQLITDTAETAANIELQALGRAARPITASPRWPPD